MRWGKIWKISFSLLKLKKKGLISWWLSNFWGFQYSHFLLIHKCFWSIKLTTWIAFSCWCWHLADSRFGKFWFFWPFVAFFHAVWNNFWLKGATLLKIDQKTSQTIKIKVRKSQGFSSYRKKVRTGNWRGVRFWPLPYQINVHQVQFI